MDLKTLHASLRARLPDVIGDLRALTAEHAPNVAREAGYTLRNVDDDTAVLRIYDEIWWLGVNAESVARDLDQVDRPNIRVEINSPGGDVFDGIAIYNALLAHPAEVTTRIDGVAASIASVIAQAGDVRQIAQAGQMMIHNAWGVTIGDSREHEAMAALLDQQDQVIAGIYASASGSDPDGFRQMMAAETWLTAQQTLDEGLVDDLVDLRTNETSASATRRTLNDELDTAMGVVASVLDSAERVAALRADVGKSLSVVNVTSLDGLRDSVTRLNGLLAPSNDQDGHGDVVANEYARFVALTQEIHA